MRSSYHRIVAGACALALLIPAAASAQPIHDQPAQSGQLRSTSVVYGDATYEAQNARDLGTGGSYADQISAIPPEQLAAAYGTANIDAKPVAPPRAAIVTDDGGTNGWRLAAVIEAGVLASLALAAAVLLTGRRRAPRMGH